MASSPSRTIAFFRALLGVAMVTQGVNHFLFADFMVRMMPPWLPWHRELVLASGVAEIALGLLVFVPSARRLAGYGLLALYVAVFPANVEMARRAEDFDVPEALLWLRLPLQLVFFWWAWATCIRPTHRQPPT